MGFAVLGLIASRFYYGSLTVLDTIGTIMSTAIFAYILHLLIQKINRNT
jgi:NhaP-type Na+/H+ or K+/H+ antiporter